MNALKYECGYFSEGYCTIFFYIVYFMYLLYILCIGSCDCYWNNAEEMMCVISTDLLAILEQTWKKKLLTSSCKMETYKRKNVTLQMMCGVNRT